MAASQSAKSVVGIAQAAAGKYGMKVCPFNISWYNDVVEKELFLPGEAGSLGLLLCALRFVRVSLMLFMPRHSVPHRE